MDSSGDQSTPEFGFSISFMLCFATNGQAFTVLPPNPPERSKLTLSLDGNEIRLWTTVPERSPESDAGENLPAFSFYTNAVVEPQDDECVLISHPYWKSCFIYFESSGESRRFREDVKKCLSEGMRTDLEAERRLLRGNSENGYEEPFADFILESRNLPGGKSHIIELDAGLGVVSEALTIASTATLAAITRPGLAHRLDTYLAGKACPVLVDSDPSTSQLAEVRASVLISRRLSHFLFDSDILKRFLRFRDTKLSSASSGRLLPSELIIKAALIRDKRLCEEKLRRSSFWLRSPHGVNLSCLHDRAQDEEFTVPEIGYVSKYSFVSEVKECNFSLKSGACAENSFDGFYIQLDFRPQPEAKVHGIVFWCDAAVDGKEVRCRETAKLLKRKRWWSPNPTETWPEASVACVLKKSLPEVSSLNTVTVYCEFSVNRGQSYDISVEYRDCGSGRSRMAPSTKYSMMLAAPHPYGKTIRRESDIMQRLPAGP